MQAGITLPHWQFFLLLALAAYAVFRLLFLPLLQALIYRRSRTTERILEQELTFGLPAYAQANRQLWVDRLISDPQVSQMIEDLAAAGRPRAVVISEARRHAAEIVPSFSALLYFRIGYWVARKWLRMFYWIQVGFSAQREYRKIPKDSCVVMVSNHRSNFDPLLLIYLTSKTAPVSYSAGEWALAFPFRQFLHLLGFFVVRRDRRDDRLYHKLLERYVFLATSHCVPQGVFVEGGLSRDGRMQPLKLGMLNYLVKALGQGGCRDIVFVPCALNYDKIPEDRTLIAHQQRGFGMKGRAYSLFSFVKFLATVLAYVMPRRHKPFGYACVNFGQPLSLQDWQRRQGVVLAELEPAERRRNITALGQDLAGRIAELLPVLPTYLLASVLGNSDDLPVSELTLKVRATRMIDGLTAAGVPVFLPNNDGDYALSQGIYVLLRRKIIEPTGDGRFQLVEAQRKLLEYYCNTIAGFADRLPAKDVPPCA